MADDSKVQYSSATGNDYPSHERQYENFTHIAFVGACHVVNVVLALTIGTVIGGMANVGFMVAVLIVATLVAAHGLVTGTRYSQWGDGAHLDSAVGFLRLRALTFRPACRGQAATHDEVRRIAANMAKPPLLREPRERLGESAPRFVRVRGAFATWAARPLGIPGNARGNVTAACVVLFSGERGSSLRKEHMIPTRSKADSLGIFESPAA